MGSMDTKGFWKVAGRRKKKQGSVFSTDGEERIECREMLPDPVCARECEVARPRGAGPVWCGEQLQGHGEQVLHATELEFLPRKAEAFREVNDRTCIPETLVSELC